ncbi:hypothetical protein NX801_28130 [Streptomyces sp. LP05-1]|uniref:Activator of Hsp90 ATPase 1 family protein n=1 Tax=Streptomyces pyxinae TaxID=2970734 RepID=A0ABT2CPS6_9ACTN|nr:hypothetical protein [Streptomyces sp. LP05-1]MCS0639433.1 hypothetical protein [Streptomyces sp. LP05-1]
MALTIPPGTSETDGTTHVLRFAVPLPHPQERVWLALATPGGLRGWLAVPELLQCRLGGEAELRFGGEPEARTGTVTAWDVERIAEYTVEGQGRFRFHLEPGGPEATRLRFTLELEGSEERRLDALADWHERFLLLLDALDGHPADWTEWTARADQAAGPAGSAGPDEAAGSAGPAGSSGPGGGARVGRGRERWQELRDDYEARDYDAS